MKKINNLNKLYTIWNFRKTCTEAMRRKNIPGVAKFSRMWFIPKDAEKSVDGKLKEPKF